MRFFCFVAYLIGFRRILLLVLILMAIAIVQHHRSELRQLAAPMHLTSPPRPTSSARTREEIEPPTPGSSAVNQR